MFAAPPLIETRVYARLPERYRLSGQDSAWVAARGAGPLHSFLEGPAFDREGNLYCVDIPYGRILKVDAHGQFAVAAKYDGEPNGLTIHRDGRLFIADRRHGILAMDSCGGRMETIVSHADGMAFQGVNDLHFASDGVLYFTDQGDSALQNPTGRVCRYRPGAVTAEVLMQGLAGPNGLVLSRDETLLYVAVTRDNAIYSLPLPPHGGLGKAGRFIQLSGSPTGPDGLALDSAGNLAIVHAGFGTVWLFSALGEPLYRIRSCAGLRTTNLAYGGRQNKTLFITEAQEGVILCADLPVAGQPLYSHASETWP